MSENLHIGKPAPRCCGRPAESQQFFHPCDM